MQHTSPSLSPIMAVILRNVNNGKQGCTNPHNWPLDAVFAVEYTLRDRQFPDVDHGVTAVYFNGIDEYNQWLDDKAEWIQGTDYDFSLTGTKYEWDLGPNAVGSVHLN